MLSSFLSLGNNILRYVPSSLIIHYKFEPGDMIDIDISTAINNRLKNYATGDNTTVVNGALASSAVIMVDTTKENSKNAIKLMYSENTTNNGYILMNNKLNFSKNLGLGVYSLSMWFKTFQTDLTQLAVFGVSDTVTYGAGSTMIRVSGMTGHSSTHQPVIREYTVGSTTAEWSNPAPFNLTGVWNHVVWSGFGNSNTRSYYVNGVQVGTTRTNAIACNINATGTISRLGNSSWLPGEHIDGFLSNVQIYVGVITKAQALELYNYKDGKQTIAAPYLISN